ncbi:DUF6056 family protein [Aeromonas hydrophila]|uniref:DUF6056 family protein n=1 Tax=Aeromonas hydrophila TaxID=644 RepID=UPI00235EBE9C|nr:DUF6056 family protein [Aeromonas hydrophila]
MKSITKLSIVLISLAIITLHLTIQINVPMHSDDFSYALMNGEFAKLYNHYMWWSGRVVADFLSSTLLSKTNLLLLSALNSIVYFLMVFFISITPYNIFKKNVDNGFPILLIIISLLLWVANQSLGETTFWLVGSFNYMWTGLLILVYMNSVIWSSNNDISNKLIHLSVVFLGLLAGWTNENTGIIASVFTFYILFLNPKNKTTICLSGLASFIGWLGLILSPGNSIRAQVPLFEDWYSHSFLWRIDVHIFDRMPMAMSGFWLLYLAMIMLFCFHDKKSTDEKSIKYSVFFFFSSLLSMLILVGAPVIAPRSTSGCLMFLLLTYSFVFYDFYNNEKSKAKTFSVSTLTISFLLIYFIPSYYLMSSAMFNIKNQTELRYNIIAKEKSIGQKTIGVPDYFFGRLLKNTDQLSTYNNSEAFGKYLGVEKVFTYPVGFDSGQIIKKNNYLKIEGKLNDGIKICGIYIYNSLGKPFFTKSNHVLFEMTSSPDVFISNDDLIYFHIFKADGTFINSDIGRSRASNINGLLYYDLDLGGIDISINDIDKINYGIFNKETGEHVVSLSWTKK